MHLIARLSLLAALTAGSVAAFASDFIPETLHRVQAYDGPARPRGEVAILFTMDGRPWGESATICAIDGLSLEKDGVCASVVYVLPGIHELKLKYSSDSQFGAGNVTINAAANQLYQINFSSLRVDYRARIIVIPMYDGAKLSWRNMAPGLATRSPRVDEEVPYEPNTERGGPLPTPVLSDADRATVDRLLGCAGSYAADIELRKFDHREYAFRYDVVGSYVEAATSYVSVEEAMRGQKRRHREAVDAYAAARVPQDAATEESKSARARLEDELNACAEFLTARRPEIASRARQRPQ